MAPVYALDRFYLAITLLVTVGYQLAGFAIAWTFKFDKITDFTGGSNFFLLALLTLLIGNTFHARNIVASVLVMVWAARIAGFLLFRVLKMGSDSRFDEIRNHFLKFLGFWIGQIIWVWTVSLPLTILNSPAISDTQRAGSDPTFGTSRDIAGIVLWALGFVIESLADFQKYYYKANKLIPKDMPTNRGLWAWSRHPPYFGEIMCWWGIWILCLSPTTNGNLPYSSRAAQYGAVMSPIFTVLLQKAPHVRIRNSDRGKANGQKVFPQIPWAKCLCPSDAWRHYQAYLKKTSILIPLPPSLYIRVPAFLKRTILFDFPFYQFDEERDGKAALEEASANEDVA